MKYPHTAAHAEIDEKNSRFIAELIPLTCETQLRQRQNELRQQHPKASHVCTAFRVLNAQHQISEGFSDDGEPGGTAGAPMLRVLQHHDRINCAVLITRYFGGKKLGTGGLQRAYSQATAVVAQSDDAVWHTYRRLSDVRITCEFAGEAGLRRTLMGCGISCAGEQYSEDGVTLQVFVTDDELNDLQTRPELRLCEFVRS